MYIYIYILFLIIKMQYDDHIPIFVLDICSVFERDKAYNKFHLISKMEGSYR